MRPKKLREISRTFGQNLGNLNLPHFLVCQKVREILTTQICQKIGNRNFPYFFVLQKVRDIDKGLSFALLLEIQPKILTDTAYSVAVGT